MGEGPEGFEFNYAEEERTDEREPAQCVEEKREGRHDEQGELCGFSLEGKETTPTCRKPSST